MTEEQQEERDFLVLHQFSTKELEQMINKSLLEWKVEILNRRTTLISPLSHISSYALAIVEERNQELRRTKKMRSCNVNPITFPQDSKREIGFRPLP